MSHDKNVHDKKIHDKKSYDKKENENIIEGRNAVMEAFRSGKPVDKLYVLDGCQDGVRERKTPGCDRKCCRI